MRKFYPALLIALVFSFAAKAQLIKNFTQEGQQITKFDNLGNAVDAHDGEIAYFNGTYYLYGTSYDCGFEWNNKTAPFCGFKSYSSKDMVTWKDEGYLFDAKTPLWQSRCDGKTYGCFRPHVIYNKKNKTYILWINVYDNVSGYRVFTAKTPIGPFIETKEPKIAVNSNMPAAGLNNGDHDLFIDDDGTGYLALTDWRTRGTIVIEQLTDDYLSGTGKVARSITNGNTEAPALFKRKGIYYVTYSDPNCGYCSGTGTSYKTARSPLGPWSEGKKISDNSCGGQPSFVSTMKVNSETIYLYGSDLWNNAAKNEALANFYWAPLTFAEDGSINPMECIKSFSVTKSKKNTSGSAPLETNDFKAFSDIGGKIQRSQSFTAAKSGRLKTFEVTTLKNGYPLEDLSLDFYESEAGKIKGSPLAKIIIPRDSLGWSARGFVVNPNVSVTSGKQYTFVLKSDTGKGFYGFAYNDSASNSGTDNAAISTDYGQTFTVEKNRKLKFNWLIE
ncbi:family 43 glycosylhydrolase [Pedobacter metabolipauper]|uniref:Glycosyl hydrolase family 43 n=1 Tax=Pedobacter metabolipauper TaxID=425513 RepID=A0A4R6SW89_9SPHI|nr:family 43 glycosylhydrolase [Pedobacter metabolipauper]TDQ08641.1 glycosyl hydrolase family 43 [Pedobacter metabolipauper]